MIRILIAEDSATAREYLSYLIGLDPEFELVGTARNGREAVELAERKRPDLIVMDVHMPFLNGFEATRLIMEQAPTRIVMVTASSSRLEAHGAFKALDAGALMLVGKPPGPGDPTHVDAARELTRTLKLMAEVKVVRRWPKRGEPAPAPSAPIPTPGAASVVAIGASTGGPPVLAQLLQGLPAGFGCSILLVQHIAAGFTDAFAEWLATTTPLRVKLAEAHEPLQPGTVYVAGTNGHLGVTRDGRIAITRATAANGFCPSVSHLFESVADAYGPAAVGILLTGMGRDGADGLRRLRDAGALTIAQDEPSSVVFGMPGEAVRLHAAELVLPPERIGETLRSLAPGRPA